MKNKERLEKTIQKARAGAWAISLSEFSDILESVFDKTEMRVLSEHLKRKAEIKGVLTVYENPPKSSVSKKI